MPITLHSAVERPIVGLVPVEYNPRTERANGLEESLESFGYLQFIVVNTAPGREGRIVGGEKRWRALIADGATSAMVVEVSLPLDRERELNVRLNRAHAEWDWAKLAAEFDSAELIQWGFEIDELPVSSLLDVEFIDAPSVDSAGKRETNNLSVIGKSSEKRVGFQCGAVKVTLSAEVYEALRCEVSRRGGDDRAAVVEQVIMEGVRACAGLS